MHTGWLFFLGLLIRASAVLAYDYSFSEPTDIRKILLSIASTKGVNLIIGDQVEGLTTFVARGISSEQALVEAAVGAGFTVRKVDTILAVRGKSISPGRIDRRPMQFLTPGIRLTIDAPTPTSPRTILRSLASQLGRPFRLHKHSRGTAIVKVREVDPRVFLNLFCESMGLDWGRADEALVIAPYRRIEHYEIEMAIDRRGRD